MNLNKDTLVNESRFEDIAQYQEIVDAKTIYELLGDTIILDRYANDFDYLFDRVVDVAVLCWANTDERGDVLQHTMIKFKVDIDETIMYELPLNRFMLSLVFIRPVIQFIKEVDVSALLVDDILTDKMRIRLQDNVVNMLIYLGFQMKERLDIMAHLSLALKELLLIFSHADMQIFTANNLFLDHYRESEVIRDINNTRYPSTMQTVDIIEENAKRYAILEKEMTERGNPFFEDNKYIKTLKPKQMEELYINFSQIPDGVNLVPVIMNGNGFNAGYGDEDVFYAGGIAARVPDIMNGDKMGESGYFARNLRMITNGTISKTVYDCGSKNPIPLNVTEESLDMLAGRYYFDSPESDRMKMLTETDKHLIGKKLWFRSPCTCNLNEDCCHVCYGSRALKVGTLPGGFIYTTDILTSRVGQNVLSAKHLLRANSKRIELNVNFDKYFTLAESAVYVNDDKNFDIYLPDDYLDDIAEKFVFYVTRDLIPIEISQYANISVADFVLDNAKEVILDDKTYLKISSAKLVKKDIAFCNIMPINIMMTQKYMDIKRLFDVEMSKFTTISEAVEKLMSLTIDTIPVLSVHNEVMIGKHVRQIENSMLRPNFLEPDAPYQLMTLKNALQNSESATIGLAFEKAAHQLQHSVFDKRNKINRVGAKSFEDYLFGYEIS